MSRLRPAAIIEMAMFAGALVRRDEVGAASRCGGELCIIAGEGVGFWQRMAPTKEKIPLRDKDVAASIEVIS